MQHPPRALPYREKTQQRRVEAIDKLVTIVTITVGITLSLQAIGFDVNSLLAIGGIGGIALSLAGREVRALQGRFMSHTHAMDVHRVPACAPSHRRHDTSLLVNLMSTPSAHCNTLAYPPQILENLFNGLVILSSTPFETGDEVWFKPAPTTTVEGIVVDVGWFRTQIRSFEREVWVVPNSVFSKARDGEGARGRWGLVKPAPRTAATNYGLSYVVWCRCVTCHRSCWPLTRAWPHGCVLSLRRAPLRPWDLKPTRSVCLPQVVVLNVTRKGREFRYFQKLQIAMDSVEVVQPIIAEMRAVRGRPHCADHRGTCVMVAWYHYPILWLYGVTTTQGHAPGSLACPPGHFLATPCMPADHASGPPHHPEAAPPRVPQRHHHQLPRNHRVLLHRRPQPGRHHGPEGELHAHLHTDHQQASDDARDMR